MTGQWALLRVLGESQQPRANSRLKLRKANKARGLQIAPDQRSSGANRHLRGLLTPGYFWILYPETGLVRFSHA
jgi:hypothetical protein